MVYRAYSILTVKAVEEEARTFSGMATTPTPDRVGDVVEPLGVKFQNPLSLLLYHDSKLPVGEVKFGKPTKDGIPFVATIPDIPEEGRLRERVNEAWQSVKYRLIRGVSIGFRPLNDAIEILKTGGLRFLETEVLELSLVAIPANAEATITAIKAIDAQHLPASGVSEEPVTPTSPRVTGTVVAKSATPQPRNMKQSITDQIKALEATRAALVAERDAIMDGATEKGEVMDAAQTEKYDELEVQVKNTDGHLARLRAREVENKAAAVEVKGGSIEEASKSRGGVTNIVSVKANRAPGIGLARVAMAKLSAYLISKEDGIPMTAMEVARQRWPDDREVQAYISKATVAGGTTTDSTWASPLVEPTTLEQEFIEFLRPMTILGKFGTNGIPSLRRLPFNVRIPRQTSGGTGYWVGEGAPKPVTKSAFDDVTMPYTKVASLSVITQELARFSRPSAEQIVRDTLAANCRERIDTDFVDPAKAVSSGVNPASITNGLTALSSAGADADDVRTDVQNLLEPFLVADMSVENLVLVMPNTLALALSLLRNSLGQKEFPDVTLRGGFLEGIPVITSQYAANESSYGNLVIAIDASSLGLADDGQVDIKVSTEAALQMLDNPTNNVDGTATTMVSLWQTNSIGILAEQFIHWVKLRSGAVVYMDDVNWGSIGSPV